MRHKKTIQAEIYAVCAELGPEDGVDPRDIARQNHPHKGNRKVLQLSRQVAETLELVFGGECSDDLLRGLHVMAVDPAPDASRLLVTVCSAIPGEEIDAEKTLASLEAISGKLRCEVAAAITRKRAPKLVFRVQS